MRVVLPDDADIGPPYARVETDEMRECFQCGEEIRISQSVIDEMGYEWEYECWCGAFIHFTRTQ